MYPCANHLIGNVDLIVADAQPASDLLLLRGNGDGSFAVPVGLGYGSENARRPALAEKFWEHK